MFYKKKKTWPNARSECQKIDGGYDLAVINDASEADFLKEQLTTQKYMWIGLKKNETSEDYVWVDSSLLQYGAELGKDPWQWQKPSKVFMKIRNDFDLTRIKTVNTYRLIKSELMIHLFI